MFDRNVTPMDLVMYAGLAFWLAYAAAYAANGDIRNLVALAVIVVVEALVGGGRYLVFRRQVRDDGSPR